MDYVVLVRSGKAGLNQKNCVIQEKFGHSKHFVTLTRLANTLLSNFIQTGK